MRKALAPLLFDDEELDGESENPGSGEACQTVRFGEKEESAEALRRKGLVVQSFDTLLEELGTRCRNRCRIRVRSSKDRLFIKRPK